MKPMPCLAICLAAVLPSLAADQDPVIVTGDVVTVRTTVESIDPDHRTVTLVEQDGDRVTLYGDPRLDGFDRLKAGDEVTFRYLAPVILEVHTLDNPAASGGSRGKTFRGARWTPSNLVAPHVTERVTVTEADPGEGTLTFETGDDRTITLPVDDGSMLKELHAGDAIDITYTHPVLIGLE